MVLWCHGSAPWSYGVMGALHGPMVSWECSMVLRCHGSTPWSYGVMGALHGPTVSWEHSIVLWCHYGPMVPALKAILGDEVTWHLFKVVSF